MWIQEMVCFLFTQFVKIISTLLIFCLEGSLYLSFVLI